MIIENGIPKCANNCDRPALLIIHGEQWCGQCYVNFLNKEKEEFKKRMKA